MRVTTGNDILFLSFFLDFTVRVFSVFYTYSLDGGVGYRVFYVKRETGERKERGFEFSSVPLFISSDRIVDGKT